MPVINAAPSAPDLITSDTLLTLIPPIAITGHWYFFLIGLNFFNQIGLVFKCDFDLYIVPNIT